MKFWIVLIVAQVVVLIALAAAGQTTSATPALRYTGFACIAGIFLCIPPLMIKLFVAGQHRIGNGAVPMVQTIERHQAGITVGVWALTVMALVLALPRIKADIAAAGNQPADSAADTRTASVANGPESLASVLEATSAASVTSSSIAASNVSNSIDSDSAKVLTPGAGSATRTAILDALRQRLKIAGKFRVDHIRTWNRWAFVRATEVVELDKGELQETDMTVAALLELPTGSTIGSWRIVNLWTLPDEQVHPMKDFLRAIREKQRSEHLPAALFPQDLD